jgi:hypothetical protein
MVVEKRGRDQAGLCMAESLCVGGIEGTAGVPVLAVFFVRLTFSQRRLVTGSY